MPAIRELLDRTLGRPVQGIELSQADAEQELASMSVAELMEILRREQAQEGGA